MLTEALSQFDWHDLIDIAVIAFIIYKTLTLLIGTRAIALVKGMMIMGVISVIARYLDLQAFSWILAQFFGVLLIVIPIVFQPELRKLLGELGSRNIIGAPKINKRAETLTDEVVKALMYLRAHKIGALIVMQKEMGLKEFWRSAVILDADITQELIISIFWKDNPLHDGAVIMDREKLIAASSYLPLTENTNLSRWLGTRHRAALGISEVSDAYALVVSEERGEVSLTVGGYLSRNLNESQLRGLLSEYFSNNGKDQPFLEKLRDEIRALEQRERDDDV